MSKLRARAGTLAYVESGSGPATVLIPSFPADSRMYADLLRHPVGRVIAIDPPGFGRSPASKDAPEAYSIVDFAAAIGRLVDRLDLERPVVVGTGLGGHTAIELVASRPRSFAGLVTIGSGPTPDPVEKAGLREEMARNALTNGMAVVSETAWKNLHPQAGPRARATMTRMVAEADPAGYAAGVRGMALRPDPALALARIRVPTLAMRGKDDPFSSTAGIQRLAAMLPRAAVLEVPGAHLAPLEYPAAFRHELERFLVMIRGLQGSGGPG